MNRLIAAMLLGMPAILMLSGCLTMNSASRVAGSEVGGTIPMTGLTRPQAVDMARSHCAMYGRSAHILAIRPEDGGMKAIFECTS
ncbi:MAG: hypothetical protein J2P53_10650 [Bradyrhizobiaceae bacterium]|nr:hypothetical protein [Bradyrhizobiaceae bacterium]